MVCPSCGRQVAGMEAACRFCGAAVKSEMTPSPDCFPLAGGGTKPGEAEDRCRQRRDARASLILGIISFATLPVAFAFSCVFANLPVTFAFFKADLPENVLAVLFTIAILAGVLALVLGRRANQAIRRTEGRLFGDDRAKPGMVLGAIGAGIWSLLILVPILVFILSLIAPNLFFHLLTGGSPVGSLRTINTAAITYSSQYGHGFPLRLSFLAPPKLGQNGGHEDTNDHAACLIDEILASGNKSGYRFYYVAGPVDSKGMVQTYTVHADPIVPSHEHPYYFTDQTGVIRKQSGREANATSPPVN